VWMRAPRSVRWTADHVAFVSDDSILAVDLGTRDLAPRPKCEVRFKNVTAVSNVSLVDIQGAAERTIACEFLCERSLFAPLARRRMPPSFFTVSNADARDDVSSFVTWRTEGLNIFGPFDPLVEIKSANTTRSSTVDAERWQKLLGEQVRVTPVQLARLLTPSRLIHVRPDDLTAEYQMADGSRWRSADCGVDVSKLPKVHDEK
jgi:hypothetical protein